MKQVSDFRIYLNQGAALISVLVFLLVSLMSIQHLTRAYLSFSNRYSLYSKTQQWQSIVDSELNRQIQVIMLNADDYWYQFKMHSILNLESLHEMTEGSLKITLNKLDNNCLPENQMENIESLCLSMNIVIKNSDNPMRLYPSSTIEFAILKPNYK